MRCVIIENPGRSYRLALADRKPPRPEGEEVRVRVQASALNRADLLQMRGLYPVPPGYPEDIPGLEFAGLVESKGASAREAEVGDRVFGLTGGGAFAEFVVVHEGLLVKIPDNLTFQEAAAVPEAFVTAHDALLTQGALSPGENVLVNAVASGVGTAAVQVASLVGADCIGVAGSKEKLRAVSKLVRFHPVERSAGDPIAATEEAFGPASLDLILDLLGGGGWSENLRLLRSKGRLVLVGLLQGARAEVRLDLILRKRLRIIGTVMRARPLEEKIEALRKFAGAVVPHLASGRLRPVVDSVFPMERIDRAIERMESRINVGKIVITFGRD